MDHNHILESYWISFLVEIEAEYGKETIDRWARSLKVQASHNTLSLAAKDSFQALWIEEHMLSQLKSYLAARDPKIKVALNLDGEKKSASPRKSSFKKASSFQLYFPELDPTATYEQFIKYGDNEIPLRFIEEICSKLLQRKLKTLSTIHAGEIKDDSLIPNPIYLYGPTGCGKTHLLQAIAHKLKRAGIHALYARSDIFTEHVVKAIRAGEMAYFRHLWRNADVLLIDDVHLLAKKSATQEEFFHTFNTLHVANKPIFLASSCMTQQLQFIEPRLVSRFDWGIGLPLVCLPKKMYKVFMEQKAAALHFPLPPKITETLVSLFPSNPKMCAQALEATILRTTLPAHYTKKSIDTLTGAQLRTLLKDLIEEEEQAVVTFEKIISATSQVYGVLEADLLGKSQSRECVLPRQVAMYLLRKHFKMPYMKIGDRFFRDHSTVMSGIRQVEKGIKEASSNIGSAISSIEILLHN
jgi:chromosomal replication initiator protein